MLDLKAEYLTIIKMLLKKYVPGMTVWAYGSRVSGKSHPGSDLDLVVINPAAAAVNLSQLKTALSESDLPITVDVLDWSTIPESFQQEIQRNYLVIQQSP